MDLDILRRIAERGLKLAQREDDKFIDIFQHLLDEIERCKKEVQYVDLSKMSKRDRELYFKQLRDLLNVNPTSNSLNVLKIVVGILCIVSSIIAGSLNFPYFGWILAAGIISILTIEE